MKGQALRTITLVLFASLVFLPLRAWAAPSITSLTGTPTTFPPKVQTKVTLTATVTNPTFVKTSVQVERQAVDGTWKNFAKTDFSSTSNPLVFTGKVGFNEPTTGVIRIRISATFTSGEKNKYVSPVLNLSVGQSTTPSTQDQTIQGGGGTSVTIPGGSLQQPAQIGIAPAPAGTIPISSPEKPLVTTVDVIVASSTETDAIVLTQPLEVSVPAPAGTPDGARFLFVVPVLAPSLTGAGLERKLLFVDTGVAQGGQITTESTFFPGITTSTTVAVVKETGTVYVTGTVTDAQGDPRPGVWVQETLGGSPTCTDPGTLCQYGWYTNALGQYRLEATGTPAPGSKTDWSGIAIDVFRCNSYTIATRRDDTNIDPANAFTLNLVVAPDASFQQRLTGIRNSGFEARTVADVPKATNCWPALTDGQLISATANPAYKDLFGLNTTITPQEGDYMAVLTRTNTTIEQKFLLPALFKNGDKKLRFDFHFGCQETGVTCPTPRTSPIGVKAEVLDSAGNALSPAKVVTKTFVQFDGQLGWRTAELDLANLYDAGGTPTTSALLRLRFTLTNPDVDATVLLDNIRFDTIFVNATVLSGVGVIASDVQAQVRHTNELLSQAGANVRIRTLTTGVSQVDSTCNSTPLELVNDGGGAYGTDLTTSGSAPWIRSNEHKALSCLGAKTAYNAGAPNGDIEVTYVKKFYFNANCSIFGVATTVEEYQYQGTGPAGTNLHFDQVTNYASTQAILDDNLKNETAIFVNTSRDYSSCSDATGTFKPDKFRETLAHEIGHLLINQLVDAGDVLADIRADEAGGTLNLEHRADDASLMTSPALCRFNVCSGRVHLNVQQLRRWRHPNPPAAPRCPVTCPH